MFLMKTKIADNGLIQLKLMIVTCSSLSNQLNQCWHVIRQFLRNKLQWNMNQNTHIFFDRNAFWNIICNMSAILFRIPCFRYLFCHLRPCLYRPQYSLLISIISTSNLSGFTTTSYSCHTVMYGLFTFLGQLQIIMLVKLPWGYGFTSPSVH